MGNTIYYYKTSSDTWHFSTGVSKDAFTGSLYKRDLERGGKKVEKLYLNIPEHFEIIKKNYRTPEYWAGRTWIDEYEESFLFIVTISGPRYFHHEVFRDEKKARDYFTDCLVRYPDYEVELTKGE